MAKYNYGKSFTRNGKLMRYRYTNKKKSSKKLVRAPAKRYSPPRELAQWRKKRKRY